MAHTLQLSVNKAMDEAGVDAILSKCRRIISHFQHSPANAGALTEQTKLKMKEQMLIQDVSTRWNSTLEMIERLNGNKKTSTCNIVSTTP